MFQRVFGVESVASGSRQETELSILQQGSGSEAVVVWDAALVLAKFLEKHQQQLQLGPRHHQPRKFVLELGSGTGILGLVASVLGADVILSDYREHLPLLIENIKTNIDKLHGEVEARELRWGNEEDIETILAEKKQKPDIILISDCIYYEDSLSPLISTVKKLSGAETRVLLSYEQRETPQKIEVQNQFFNLISEDFEAHQYSTSDCHKEFSCDDIKVFSLQVKTKN